MAVVEDEDPATAAAAAQLRRRGCFQTRTKVKISAPAARVWTLECGWRRVGIGEREDGIWAEDAWVCVQRGAESCFCRCYGKGKERVLKTEGG